MLPLDARGYGYLIQRFQSPMYDVAIEPTLRELDVCSEEQWRAAGMEGLVVLRSTIMDPHLATPSSAPDHISGFVAALRHACNAAYAELSRDNSFAGDAHGDTQ